MTKGRLATIMGILIVSLVSSLILYLKSDSNLLSSLRHSAEKATTTNQSVIDISSVADFQWDTLVIVTPYTPVARVHAQLGYKWRGAEESKIESSETFHLLVFVKNGKVVQHYKMSRSLGDFEGLAAGNIFTPDNDVFDVRRVDGDGSRRKRLIFTARRRPAAVLAPNERNAADIR